MQRSPTDMRAIRSTLHMLVWYRGLKTPTRPFAMGHITRRGPVELRTAFVQMMMRIPRLRNKTGGYWFVSKYRTMKEHTGTGRA
ncbi:MAG: hypothetical protein J7J07_08955 [Syntrophobacterales bacterium]|nr:hypothetical protein [Syntrophobacterales bacterium]